MGYHHLQIFCYVSFSEMSTQLYVRNMYKRRQAYIERSEHDRIVTLFLKLQDINIIQLQEFMQLCQSLHQLGLFSLLQKKSHIMRVSLSHPFAYETRCNGCFPTYPRRGKFLETSLQSLSGRLRDPSECLIAEHRVPDEVYLQ